LYGQPTRPFFYHELGGTAGQSILTSGDPDLSLFSNIQTYTYYWFATEFSERGAWVFDFTYGRRIAAASKDHNHFVALAVRSGDVSAVPVPAQRGYLAAV
jgi:hypothetical protein